MKVCPSCARENPDDARFCSGCGTPLEERAAAREERKVVTVLFCDLVGSTARAEQLDPEDVRATLSRYYARLRSDLERYGGTVEKFIGDAVMALFGAPVAHEDDPERAVRAALAVRDWAEEEGELQVRIGITTGEALVSIDANPREGEGMAAGDVVNTAARLQAAAAANAILVDEQTYRATRERIDFGAVTAVTAKGKAAPVSAWAPLSPRSKLGVDVVQTARTELVGRDNELGVLIETARRAHAEREPQLVTLVGVPGIGKSRLLFELLEALRRDGDEDELVWRQGRCLPYGERVKFWALGEIVKSHAGIFEGDSVEQAEEKLARALAGVDLDAREVTWLDRNLRPLIGIGGDGAGHGEEEVFAAWRRFFEALAEQRPLAVVIEDLHWADDDLLDFVDHLVEWAHDLPLLVVCTARPELLERRPNWGGGKPNATTLSLRPLSDEATARLLASLLSRPLLPAEEQRALLDRAGGNPLYAEQYAQLVGELPDETELPVPESVQGIIAARLDALAAQEKGFLQDAAVVGKVFWAGALSTLSDQVVSTVIERLHALERKEFVRRQRRSSVAGEEEYAFRHILVRDVAYGQMPRAARAEKHRRAAEWMGALQHGRDDHAEVVAEHYAEALELTRAVGAPTAELEERARIAFRAAADRDQRLGAYAAAARLYAKALELWPPDDERAYVLLELARSLGTSEGRGREEAREAANALLAQGDADAAADAIVILSGRAWNAGRRDEAVAHAARATRLVADRPPSRAKARVLEQTAFLHVVAGETNRGLELSTQLLQLAEQLALDEEKLSALIWIGLARLNGGDGSGADSFERALALARETNRWVLPTVAGNFAVALFDVGELRRARELIAEGRTEAESRGHRDEVDWLAVLEMRALYWAGAWDEAVAIADASIAAADGTHFRAHTIRAQISLARGRVREALEDAQAALGHGRTARDPQALDTALAVHARASLAAGARDDALASLREVLSLFQRRGTQQASSSLPDLAVTAAELGLGDEFLDAIASLPAAPQWVSAARAYMNRDYSRAADVYAAIGSHPDEAYARLRAAKALAEAGTRAEAAAQLERGLAFFRSVGATRYAAEGEAALAASA